MVLRNILIALGALALVAGAAIAIIWFNRSPAPATAAGPVAPPEGILVAAQSLPGGTLLRPADLAWKNLKPDAMPPGSIVRSPATESEFLGAVTRRDFAAGEALVESAVVKAGDRAFLSAVLLPGDRAVSIAVDAPQSVAGLVLPGDRVDLILTQSFGSDSTDPGRKSVGETVLQNIRVIAVDQSLMLVAKPGKDQPVAAARSPIPGTITLEVNELEAERVLVAVQLGKVQFAVRSLEAPGTAQTSAERSPPAIWAADVSPALRMLGRPAPMAPTLSLAPPRAAAGRPFQPPSIEVMRGSKTDAR